MKRVHGSIKTYHVTINQGKAVVDILLVDRADFNAKKVIRDK